MQIFRDMLESKMPGAVMLLAATSGYVQTHQASAT